MSGEFLDQIFVRGKALILSWLASAPDWITPIISSLLNISAVLAVFLTLFALMSVLERKILARIQNRDSNHPAAGPGLLVDSPSNITILEVSDDPA